MNGDIKLTAPGGRPGDIWLDVDNATLSEFTITGRVVSTDGTPRSGVDITVFERRSLTIDARVATTTTDARGGYSVRFTLPQLTLPDAFVRADDATESESVDSMLLGDLAPGIHVVDLVLGTGDYEGRSEWDRIVAKLEGPLGGTQPEDVPAAKLEWLCKQADAFPMHVAAYIQAHRLAEGRSVKPESCYAFLRGNLASDMRGLLDAGAAAWEGALRDAWVRHILSLPGDGSEEALDTEVASEIAAMREVVIDSAVTVPASGVNQRVVFDTAGLTEAQQRVFHELWMENEGTLEDFWAAVAASSLPAGAPLSAEVDLLKFTVQAATLVGTHLETLEALQAEREEPSISTVAELAEWSVSDWDSMLDTRSVTPPDNVPGDAEVKRQNYARVLFNIWEDAYPSASLKGSIERDELATTAPPFTEFVAIFLGNNPQFDIVDSTLATYLAGATLPWSGIDLEDQPQARINIETLQRVHRLAPRIGRYVTTRVLLAEGATSATQIVANTRTEFVALFTGALTHPDHDAAPLAGAVWDNAGKVHATVVGLASQLAFAKTNADSIPVAMSGSKAFLGAENGLAALATILGNLDYCACEHCRSVFSPAAYFADLLAFLKKRPAEEADHALALLLDRRPDLEHILLDCANTNTVLPYVDLTNELLEDFINGGLGGSSKQTTWKAAELRLHPEHLDATVYDGTTMTTVVHPWTLPFSLATVEAQTYLRHLGVARHELMRQLMPVSPSASFLDGLAGDTLGLNAVEFSIIAGLYTGNESEDDREYYGFEDGAGDNNWVAILNGTDATEGDIGELLIRARLDLDALRELLALDFINPAGDIEFDWKETCELDDAEIVSLNAAALDRLHRFVRLQRACKIPSRMLNILLRDSLGGTLTRTALRSLADIVRIKDRLRLKWDEVAVFWANVIDARDYDKEPRALYTRRFLGKDFGPVDPDFVPAENGTELAGEADPVEPITAAQLPRVLAGLGIKEQDYQLLAGSDLAADDFSFANFAALYRCVLLARSLRMSIADFVRLAGSTTGLSGLNPFTNPVSTLGFIEQVEALKDSKFSVNELDWLLRHQWVGLDPLDQATVSRELGELARGYNKIEAEVALLVDPEGEALESNLAELLDAGDVTTTIGIVDQAADLGLDQAQRETFLEVTFAGILDVDDAKDILADYTNPDYLEVATRRSWLLGRLVGHLRRRASFKDTIASKFGLSATVAESLVNNVLTDPAGSDPLAEVYRLPFASEEQINLGLDSGTHPNAFAGWTKLAKAALLCGRFKLSAAQLEWYSGRGAWLDFDALPLDAVEADSTFESWERLRRALELRKLSRPGELAPAEIAETETLAEAIAILADHAGWDAAEVLGVATDLGYLDADAAAVAEETIPERLRVVVETGNRLGVALGVLFDWATVATTMTQTVAIKAATRAKYGEDRWPEIAKPLRDAIRERQRDALVDAAIAITPALRTANDVFQHLLIDVEMSACMMTSRIKQAIASVQIFIHRVLLHLEAEEITFDPEAIERWGWMKNYRVWEANRKVFLYPENWIEPELRGDKTPEFIDLESALMQGVLDQHRVEKALGGYLEKLVRVANLEMVSVYQHPDSKEVWVLGRTHSAPHEWFVRRRDAAGAWDAWEAVPEEITTDAVAMVVKKGRLHIFWATQHEVPRGEDKRIQFRAGHIERTLDGWSKPKLSNPNRAQTLPPYRTHRLAIEVRSKSIRLWVLWHDAEMIDGRVGIGGRFRFDLALQRLHPLSTDFAVDFANSEDVELDGDNFSIKTLIANSLIALQPQYKLEGQRNVRYSDDYEVDANPFADYETASFVQGTAHVLLFTQASHGQSVAFVHQTDLLFTPDWSDSFIPAIYDDRRRKYLLEPGIAIVLQQADPAVIGSFAVDDYVICPEISAATSIDGPGRGAGVARAQDGIATRGPWGGSSAAPGQIPAINEVVFANPNVPVYLNAAVLFQGQVVMQAAVDVGSDVYPVAGFGLGLDALYHPYARDLQETLLGDGLLALYAPAVSSTLFRQLRSYDPFGAEIMGLQTQHVHGEAPIEEFDFDFGSPYGVYNWEIFFHAPMLIAAKLTTEQRFEEAQGWHHLMFNPIDIVKLEGETECSKFWRIKPFFEQAGELAKDQFEIMLGIGVTPAVQKAAIEAFAKQVAMWEANPFDPHAVARVRPGVYQRALLRKYFDNLIGWADNLFRRDTIESITEATVLYIMVAELLGRRPQEVPGPEGEAKTFAELDASGLDAFSNTMMTLENWILVPTKAVKKQGCGDASPPKAWVKVPVVSHFWYFCYPPNPELLKYWDVLEDRLFKIRHCQNIEGVERQLPLFEPPIDPALLVQAVAAGVDIQSVLAELDSGLPPYRFRSVHARASAFTNTLKTLGGALLSALEKQDAEELSRIRSGHELEMLARVRDVRRQQVDEAAAAIEAIERGIQGVESRKQHYIGLLDDGLSDGEDLALELSKKAHVGRQVQQAHYSVAGVVGVIPQVHIGVMPSVSFGGQHLAAIFNAGASVAGMVATGLEYSAGKASTVAGYGRRAQDWNLQLNQARHEEGRMRKDLISAKIRLAIAEKELANHELQAEHTESIDEYMRTKFTNRELYDWTVGQLATLYFQTYQLAFDLAKRAERAYRHELAIPTSEASVIKYGYWDSLRKGLLAGERLGHDLERLDLAYMDRDVREFELRKSVSLAELNPLRLQDLQEDGVCVFDLPEALFDLDHPGHYLRRIRSIRVTIPAVVGPHTSLGARLQLLEHVTRIDKNESPSYEEQAEEDLRFRHGTGAGQTIATSTAVNDGGLFNLDFKDERYLPFEYAGAVSSWKLTLPDVIRQFDHRTIEDVIIHVDYTAREGGTQLRTAAETSLALQLNAMLGDSALAQLVVVQDAFPNEWEQFFTLDGTDHVLNLPVTVDHFPHFARRTGFEVKQVELVLVLDPSLVSGVGDIVSVLAVEETPEESKSLVQVADKAFMTVSFALASPPEFNTWTFTVAEAAIPEELQDEDEAFDPTKAVGMLMIIRYELTPA